uniref:Uncharacterized protein n=1 Tax=Caenorhabditis japonica TaxID=281687 RepID=A0A8R1I4K2_CAEJA
MDDRRESRIQKSRKDTILNSTFMLPESWTANSQIFPKYFVFQQIPELSRAKFSYYAPMFRSTRSARN